MKQLVFVERFAAAIAFDHRRQQELRRLEGGETLRALQAFAATANLPPLAREPGVDYLGLRVTAKWTVHGIFTPVPMRTVRASAIDRKLPAYLHHLGPRTFRRRLIAHMIEHIGDPIRQSLDLGFFETASRHGGRADAQSAADGW